MQKLMKRKEPVFLCIIKGGQGAQNQRRRARGKKKPSAVLSSSTAQDSQGMTEKTKRELSKAVRTQEAVQDGRRNSRGSGCWSG